MSLERLEEMEECVSNKQYLTDETSERFQTEQKQMVTS